jgi:Uma2 family endonuclease
MVQGITLLTAEQLVAWPDDGRRHELHEGVLVSMPPAGSEHGAVGMMVAYLLMQHVWPHRLGRVFNADTGFLLARDPDLLLAPDAAFVRAARLPPNGLTRGFFEGPPDLAVEVVSPCDTETHVDDKARLYLAHGTEMVWVIEPRTQRVRVLRSDGDAVELSASDLLTGRTILPGWSCRVADLFA